ncbi:hypothetical protein KY289_030493 [Solanum tuberosum]|nr:hypothetical protein KY289_030493 [Solanum tuberosum]
MPPKKATTSQQRLKSKPGTHSAGQLVDDPTDEKLRGLEFNPGTNDDFLKTPQTTHQQAKQLETISTLEASESTDTTNRQHGALSESSSDSDSVATSTYDASESKEENDPPPTHPSEPIEVVGAPDRWCIEGMLKRFIDAMRQSAYQKHSRPIREEHWVLIETSTLYLPYMSSFGGTCVIGRWRC